MIDKGVTKEQQVLFIWILAIIKFILPFTLQDSLYQPNRDSFLYIAQGFHLDWGFMENPPMIAAFSWLTHQLGDSLFWIKVWPSLFGAFTFFFAGKIVIAIGGSIYAIFLTFFSMILGALLRVNYLFQPNAFEIFFWTLIAYSLIEYTLKQRNYFLYIFGLACGLGMLAKYSTAFFIASLLVALLISPQRKIFANKHFYFACVLGAAIFTPNVLWQMNHNWPFNHHMQELKRTQLQYREPTDFLTGQILMNLPSVFVWIMGLLYLLLVKSGRRIIFIFFTYFFVMGLLIYFHGKDYYGLGIYPTLFACGSKHLERITVRYVRFMRLVFVGIIAYLGFLMIPLLLPIMTPEKLEEIYKNRSYEKTGALKWEDQRNHPIPQDFADMLGWKEISESVARVYNSLAPDAQSSTIIYCTNYGLAGAVNYYNHALHLNLPETYSTNGSFLYWMPNQYTNVKNIILVTDEEIDANDELIQQFQKRQVADILKNQYARENGTQVILLEGGSDQVNNLIAAMVARRKKAASPLNQ
jgi:4-amino-4-deoxy-L-arabinose transferase-like glycosyltransferase